MRRDSSRESFVLTYTEHRDDKLSAFFVYCRFLVFRYRLRRLVGESLEPVGKHVVEVGSNLNSGIRFKSNLKLVPDVSLFPVLLAVGSSS